MLPSVIVCIRPPNRSPQQLCGSHRDFSSLVISNKLNIRFLVSNN